MMSDTFMLRAQRMAVALLFAMAVAVPMLVDAMAFTPPSDTFKNMAEQFKCLITAKKCANYPQFSGKQFPDTHGLNYLGVGEKASFCLRRAEDMHHWCGNNQDGIPTNASVAASYTPTGDTQVYHPDACDAGWSLYGKHCYKQVWQFKTWWEAEHWCNQFDSNLASIHNKAENEYVFTLTKGISSWIGYNDQDQDEEMKWTDNSKTDFENMSKNCTGRETEPDCQPEEKAQQWYDWNGADKGTWVCKKEAKYALKILRNTSHPIHSLASIDWEELKYPAVENAIAPENVRSLEEEEEAELEGPTKKKMQLPTSKDGLKEEKGERRSDSEDKDCPNDKCPKM